MSASAALKKASYSAAIYDVSDLEEARGVILGPEPHETVDQRWKRETPYLGGLIEQHLGLTAESLLLDYGCGVGRLSKEMIQRKGCRAIGVDQSTNMRALAANYVDDPHFAAMSADAVFRFCFEGKADAAVAVWVLQHCLNPADSIDYIKTVLKPGGLMFVLDDHRLVPTDVGFVNDGVVVKKLLGDMLELVEEIKLDPLLGTDLHKRSHCGIYRR